MELALESEEWEMCGASRRLVHLRSVFFFLKRRRGQTNVTRGVCKLSSHLRWPVYTQPAGVVVQGSRICFRLYFVEIIQLFFFRLKKKKKHSWTFNWSFCDSRDWRRDGRRIILKGLWIFCLDSLFWISSENSTNGELLEEKASAVCHIEFVFLLHRLSFCASGNIFPSL